MTKEFMNTFFSEETVTKLKRNKNVRSVKLKDNELTICFNNGNIRYYVAEDNYILTETHTSAISDNIYKEFDINDFCKKIKG